MTRLLLLVAAAIVFALPSGYHHLDPAGPELQCEGPTLAKPWQDWIDSGCWPR